MRYREDSKEKNLLQSDDWKCADMDERIGYLSILEMASTTKCWNPIFCKDQDTYSSNMARIQYYSLRDMVFQIYNKYCRLLIHSRKKT